MVPVVVVVEGVVEIVVVVVAADYGLGFVVWVADGVVLRVVVGIVDLLVELVVVGVVANYAINNVMKILFISTFREEYLLSENFIFIYLNVQ